MGDVQKRPLVEGKARRFLEILDAWGVERLYTCWAGRGDSGYVESCEAVFTQEATESAEHEERRKQIEEVLEQWVDRFIVTRVGGLEIDEGGDADLKIDVRGVLEGSEGSLYVEARSNFMRYADVPFDDQALRQSLQAAVGGANPPPALEGKDRAITFEVEAYESGEGECGVDCWPDIPSALRDDPAVAAWVKEVEGLLSAWADEMIDEVVPWRGETGRSFSATAPFTSEGLDVEGVMFGAERSRIESESVLWINDKEGDDAGPLWHTLEEVLDVEAAVREHVRHTAEHHAGGGAGPGMVM